MNERLHSRLDAEADKLGSYQLAKERLGIETEAETEGSPPSTSSRKRHTRRPTGRPAIEVSGRDMARMLANQEAIDSPDPLSATERRAVTKKGVALARAALPSAVDRAIARYDADIQNADPDYRERDERQAERALNVRMRMIAEKNSSQEAAEE